MNQVRGSPKPECIKPIQGDLRLMKPNGLIFVDNTQIDGSPIDVARAGRRG